MSNVLAHIENNRILDKFRFTYYILKFKNRFRNWLWLNVRERKIHTIFRLHVNTIIQKENEPKKDTEEEEDNIFNLINYW